MQSTRARDRLEGRLKGYTAETITQLLLLRSIYKDPSKRPKEIYKPFGLTRPTFFCYAKILNNHRDEEIKKWELKNNDYSVGWFLI